VKRLYLLRHAKSGWDAPVASDFDRPLNRRGHKAARAMAREMRALGLVFDRILASSAARVVETLEGLAEAWGHDSGAEMDPHLYLASAPTLLSTVRAAGDGNESLMIVGHNPGMEQLALLLSKEGELRGVLAEKFPTGALVEIELPVSGWADVTEGQGTLTRFIRPRDLDPDLGPEE
jgi:phosphohistidine phosphatase